MLHSVFIVVLIIKCIKNNPIDFLGLIIFGIRVYMIVQSRIWQVTHLLVFWIFEFQFHLPIFEMNIFNFQELGNVVIRALVTVLGLSGSFEVRLGQHCEPHLVVN